ncbi:hypothetical protein Lal_00023181 [Lupinus albus]|nr:hypothetical protein Lal_00023181 [Lupinus albus]
MTWHDRVVEELSAHDEPLHLVSDVDRHVSRRHVGGRAAILLKPPESARVRVVGAEERIAREVGDSRETANQKLHDDGEERVKSFQKLERERREREREGMKENIREKRRR